MPFSRLLRAVRGPWSPEAPPAPRRPAPRVAGPGPAADPAYEVLPLDVDEIRTAWVPKAGRLAVRTACRVPIGVVVTVPIVSASGLLAKLRGAVQACRALGGGWSAEVRPAREDDLALLQRALVSGGAGAARELRPRAPRFRVAVPAVVSGPGQQVFMRTITVSERGCSLAWSGDRPVPGTLLDVRLGTAQRGAALRAQVCWVHDLPGAVRAGVVFVGGDQRAWSLMLGQVSGGAAAA